MQYKGEADMLTAKELFAIEEQLKAEKLLITKNKAYAQLCEDPERRNKFEQMAAKHEDQYQTLLSLLD